MDIEYAMDMYVLSPLFERIRRRLDFQVVNVSILHSAPRLHSKRSCGVRFGLGL